MLHPPYVACLTTLPSRKVGEKIARHLVRKKVAACVNVIPGGDSYYSWKGKLCHDREVTLIMKTRFSKVNDLETELNRVHPYELPEFIVLPILDGSRRYLNWIRDSVG